MHILYLHQYFKTPESIGGTRSYEMARRLVEAGHTVTMITSTSGLDNSWSSKDSWTIRESAGIQVHAVKVSYGNNMSFMRRILAFFRFAIFSSLYVRKIKADVIFATSTPLTIILPALAAKFWHRLPLVFEVRDLWPELPIAVGALKNPMTKALARGLEWLAYHTSQHIVALSPGMADGVIKRGIPANRVTIIPNSCDIDVFDIPRERGEWVRKKLGLSHDQPLIVYAGTFGLINGAGYWAEIAAMMLDINPNIHFLLVGGGAESDKIKNLATRLSVLDKNFHLWPPAAKKEVPDILQAATVATSAFIALPPMWHNSANKFFDALAARKPIAINYGGWQADLIEKSRVGIVLPHNDLNKAAKILADFCTDSNKLTAASEEARKLAYHEFSRDILFKKFLKVLSDVNLTGSVT